MSGVLCRLRPQQMLSLQPLQVQVGGEFLSFNGKKCTKPTGLAVRISRWDIQSSTIHRARKKKKGWEVRGHHFVRADVKQQCIMGHFSNFSHGDVSFSCSNQNHISASSSSRLSLYPGLASSHLSALKGKLPVGQSVLNNHQEWWLI